jgi:hypothetical protein
MRVRMPGIPRGGGAGSETTGPVGEPLRRVQVPPPRRRDSSSGYVMVEWEWETNRRREAEESVTSELRLVWEAFEAEEITRPIPRQQIIIREVDDFLLEVYRLDASGDLQSATDKVFEYIDRLLVSKLFDVCTEILKRVNIERLSTALMRSFLTITFAAKDQIEERGAFFLRVEKEMIARRGPEVAKRLLLRLA